MPDINITNLNDGISIKDDPSAIADGATVDCVGFDLSYEGSLKVAKAHTTHDLGSYVPSGEVEWVQIITMLGTKYYLVTTSAGLYSNGVLVDATFTGRFKAMAVGGNIFLVNGTYAKRFNGTTVYQWGITAPTTAPTFSAKPNSTKKIEDFEDTTNWIANAVNCVVADESTIIKEGGHSVEMFIAAGQTGYSTESYLPTMLDTTVFDDGYSEGTDDDIVTFWFYIIDITYLERLVIEFDVVDGTYTSDFYTYQMVFDGTAAQTIDFGAGDIMFTSDQWVKIKIPKSSFARTGDIIAKDWTTVQSVKISGTANSAGSITFYVDLLQIEGGGDLSGDYYFAYGWGRSESGVVLHYSKPITSDGVITSQGPISFNRQKLQYGTRVASADPQVDCCVIYVLGGNFTEWMVYDIIFDNGTASGECDALTDEIVDTMISLYNDVAPAGTEIEYHNSRMWMLGFGGNNAATIRCSEVSTGGDVMIEGWPVKNVWTIKDETELFHLSVLSEQLVARGRLTDSIVGMYDVTDWQTVSIKPNSPYGMFSADAFIALEGSHVYPSDQLIVESRPGGASPILQVISPIATSEGITNAVGVTVGLESWFCFKLATSEYRTMKVDRTRGTPRAYYQNDKHYTVFARDRDRGKTYAVHDGEVVEFNAGYYFDPEEPFVSLTSKAFEFSPAVVWQFVHFSHNTNSNHFWLEAWVDEKLIVSFPFSSTTKKFDRVKVGPVSGEKFQFVIKGQYRSVAEIYYPIRITYS